MSLTTPGTIRTLQEALGTKAKQEPSYRFYLLYDKVSRADILAHAYALAKQRGGAAGVDGETFETIETAGRERWLAAVQEAVRAETYRPQPVRRVRIPKPVGGERPLGIPTIRDRVVQTAVLLMLQPIFEVDLEPTAYGYRPGRTAREAIQTVHRALCAGQTEVVDADVAQYFDTIPHAALMQALARRISDRKLLRLLKRWLKTPVAEQGKGGGWRYTGGKRATRGIPQGGVISPLLANLYMNRYLRAFRQAGLERHYGARLVNYADVRRSHSWGIPSGRSITAKTVTGISGPPPPRRRCSGSRAVSGRSSARPITPRGSRCEWSSTPCCGVGRRISPMGRD